MIRAVNDVDTVNDSEIVRKMMPREPGRKFPEKKRERGKKLSVARQAICTQRKCTRASNVVSAARDTGNVGLRKTFLSRFCENDR